MDHPRNPHECAWTMYASAGAPDCTKPLSFFGPLYYATQDATALRVLSVHVEIMDFGVRDDDYWAWMDPGASQPACIAATEQEMTRKFVLEQDGGPGPWEEQKAGVGEVVRLRVTELELIYHRSNTRAQWRSSDPIATGGR